MPLQKAFPLVKQSYELVGVDRLTPHPDNPRRGDVGVLVDSIEANGFYGAVVAQLSTGYVLAGNHRLMAAREHGLTVLPVVWVDVDDEAALRILLVDNRSNDLADYDQDALAVLLAGLEDLAGTGYAEHELAALLEPSEPPDSAPDDVPRQSLAERFGVPPFTLLDARRGYWRDRKAAWLSLGLRSELGRSGGLTGSFDDAARAKAAYNGQAPTGASWEAGTSIFDPVLAELLLRWYTAPGTAVLDPFAGGAVRGLVAARLGRRYTGVELRAEQVEANGQAAVDWMGRGLLTAAAPQWIVGDARDIRALVPNTASGTYGMLFTCPPYFDLERYSDDPADLSTAASYEQFLDGYTDALAAATDRMTDNAFAAIVTGAVRDRHGYVLDLPADTSRIMAGLGWRLYQDAVLATPTGSAGLRAASAFLKSRKLARVHQMVAVYHRGDIGAVRSWPAPEVGEVLELDGED
ncbi:DNA methyltransferase [Kutzneria chonburiensis]|uniref:ParB N-terminal domain-containing protein n=1 Tax=Kutzneria chonburiensis TaxID=1483604 RepID=A0ABV6N2X9_9PSEU|nr:ParB N-terminal domain-containing protein [Kutzneria chonburiensis]